MRYRCILFDLDGTLTDPKEGITKSIQYALSAFGIEEHDLEKLCSFIGPPLMDSFMAGYGMSRADAEKAVEKYRERFSVEGLFENDVYPGIDEMLASLRAGGASIALATSKPTVYAARILRYFGLSECFDYVLGSELDGTRSAKADVIGDVLARFRGTKPSECVMVGDRKHDIAGAKVCGIDSIGVLYGYGSREELVESGATFIVESVGELGRLLR